MKKIFLSLLILLGNTALSAIMVEKDGIFVHYEKAAYPSLLGTKAYTIKVINKSPGRIIFDSSILADTPVLEPGQIRKAMFNALLPRINLGCAAEKLLFEVFPAWVVSGIIDSLFGKVNGVLVGRALLGGYFATRLMMVLIRNGQFLLAQPLQGTTELNSKESVEKTFWTTSPLNEIKIDFNAIKILK